MPSPVPPFRILNVRPGDVIRPAPGHDAVRVTHARHPVPDLFTPPVSFITWRRPGAGGAWAAPQSRECELLHRPPACITAAAHRRREHRHSAGRHSAGPHGLPVRGRS
ncbi:hypothetical protein AGRA3207_007527 [Actinomadura graeca]|uniref:Uncharacterized protein n=1 Tax=Actinomadura graeca TaxID=2750812 RepID=A0ABX8RAE8_9ACTN|nr:hypothetical protein [Actinomadura graeca]QXJ25958.1 hypothetical protein AGRA3207_007527 [Actinomadura graeca]